MSDWVRKFQYRSSSLNRTNTGEIASVTMTYLMTDFIQNPEWLNADFLQYALSEYGEVEIIDYDFKRGVPPGTNYCSFTYRISVRFKTNNDGKIKKQGFFVKDPVGGMLVDMMEEAKFVEKELRTYNELLPLYRKYKSVDVVVKNFPSRAENLLILDDMSEQGYVMKDKLIQLDFEHATVALETLAKFHALSVAVYHENPALIESLGHAHAYEKPTNIAYNFAKSNCKDLGEVVSKWKGYERFADMVRTAYKTFDERMKQVYFTRSPVLNVLNHGDPWCGNMLIQEDELGNPINGKMIDLANTNLGSCGIDLNIFLFTSIKQQVIRNRLSELYDKYLNKLNWCLAEFGCPERINRQQLEDEMKATGFQALYSVFITSYYMYNNYEDLDENNQNIDIYDRKIFRSNAQEVLLHLEEIGFKLTIM